MKALKSTLSNYDFFAAVRYLTQVADTPIHYQANNYLAFPIAAISDIQSDNKKIILTTTFLSLIGQSGILPEHIRESALKALSQKNTALTDLLDIFHHRLHQLFFQAWQRHHFYVNFESHNLKNDLTFNTLNALAPQNKHYPYYAGLFIPTAPNKTALSTLIQHYFNVTVNIKEFTGAWEPLESSQCTQLQNNNYNQLGCNATLGQRVWLIQNHVTIVLEQLSYLDYLSFLPNTIKLKKLIELINVYLNNQYNITIKLALLDKQLPSLQLKNHYQLGYNAWLKPNTSPYIKTVFRSN